MANVLKHVDIMDLVTIHIYRGKPTQFDRNPYLIDIVPMDNTKKVIFDQSALSVLNQKLTEKVAGSNSEDPNTVMYMKEFAGKMLSELFKNGLVVLEDIGEAKEDHYAEARKQFKR